MWKKNPISTTKLHENTIESNEKVRKKERKERRKKEVKKNTTSIERRNEI